MPKKAEPAEPYTKFGLTSAFAKKTRRLEEVKAEIKKLEEEEEELSAEMSVSLIKHKTDLCMVDDMRVRLCNGANTSINKGLLLKNGVAVDVIERSTKRSEYTYIKITPPKGVDEEEERE
jgi:hypothetical protein